jgi:hypothetical protein
MADPLSKARVDLESRYPRRRDRRSRCEPAAAPQRAYDRRTELPRVLPLWPHELDDESPQGRRSILAKLRRTLRAERRRGIAGNWTYDLARHVGLLRVYRLELADWHNSGHPGSRAACEAIRGLVERAAPSSREPGSGRRSRSARSPPTGTTDGWD